MRSHQAQLTENLLDMSLSPSLPFSLISSVHPCVWLLWPPPGVWQPSASILASVLNVSVEWQWDDQGAREWWMAVSFPFPDRSPLIAFPGLGFAGNGLKHDMSLTRCLPREREGVPQPPRVKSQSDRLKQKGLLPRADLQGWRPGEGGGAGQCSKNQSEGEERDDTGGHRQIKHIWNMCSHRVPSLYLFILGFPIQCAL